MLLFYIRHADPIYNPDSLTEQGLLQAEALVQRMKICNPQKIFVSSSNRARLTANPSAKALGLEPEILDWCHEDKAWEDFSCIDARGKREWIFFQPEYAEVFNSDEMYKMGREWYLNPNLSPVSAEKGWQRIKKETDDFMKSLGYIRQGRGFTSENVKYDRVALFAHQGFGLLFLSCLLDIPFPIFGTHFDIGHSGVSVVEFADSAFSIPRLIQLSNDSHIFADPRLKTNYQNRIEF